MTNPAKTKVQKTCDWCGSTFEGGKKARWCCDAHKQAAYRARLVSAPVTMHEQAEKDLVALAEQAGQTWYITQSGEKLLQQV